MREIPYDNACAARSAFSCECTIKIRRTRLREIPYDNACAARSASHANAQ